MKFGDSVPVLRLRLSRLSIGADWKNYRKEYNFEGQAFFVDFAVLLETTKSDDKNKSAASP